MKLRESGMPNEPHWETLFDVELILDRLGVDHQLRDVVELGCGYGTFSLPVARRVAGTLHTYDIDPGMVIRTRQRAAEVRLSNIVCEQRDVIADGFGVADESQDACLLFNILHCEHPMGLLLQAAHVVRPGGAVLVIHWRSDVTTPRGPSLDIRPTPGRILKWAAESGLLAANGPVLNLRPWHYGIQLVKSGANRTSKTD